MKRLYLFILCLLLVSSALAQAKRKKPANFNKQSNENDQFLQKQWWLGFKAGTNLSKAVVGKSYAVMVPTSQGQLPASKKYKNFSKLGSQAALEITFTYKQLSISLQPTYRHASFI